MKLILKIFQRKIRYVQLKMVGSCDDTFLKNILKTLLKYFVIK